MTIKNRFKKINIGVGVIFILLIVYLLIQNPVRETPSIVVLDADPQVVEMGTYSEIVANSSGSVANILSNSSNVANYTWDENVLYYATDTQIVNGNNQIILNEEFNTVDFNKAFALIFTNGSLILQNMTESTSTTASLTPENSNGKVESTGQYYAALSNNTVSVFDSQHQIITNLEHSQIFDYDWFDADKLYISVEENSQHKIYLYNFALSSEPKYQEIIFPLEERFLSITHAGNAILTLSANSFIIRNTDNSAFKYQLPLEISHFSTTNIDNQNFLIVVKSPADTVGRDVDTVWVMSNSGTFDFIFDARPIPARLKETQYLTVNEQKTIVGLIDKREQLWMLSLKPGYVPVYGTNGASLIPLTSFSVEDDH